MGHSPIDAALGHRYLRIDVRSCTSRSLSLERPVLTGVTGTGRERALRLTVTPVADRPDEAFVLAPGGMAHAGVEWLAEPRGRRIEKLTVTTGAEGDLPDPVPFDVLEMRLSSRLDYYPWVTRPEEVF